MKAILLRRTGDPSALEYVDVPTPQPGEGEVLVKADTIRKLERATYDSVAFRFIAANDHPDHDTIATRRRFLPEIEGLFVKVRCSTDRSEQGRRFLWPRPALSPPRPELLPIPPHDCSCPFETDAHAATLVDIGALGGDAPDDILRGQ